MHICKGKNNKSHYLLTAVQKLCKPQGLYPLIYMYSNNYHEIAKNISNTFSHTMPFPLFSGGNMSAMTAVDILTFPLLSPPMILAMTNRVKL